MSRHSANSWDKKIVSLGKKWRMTSSTGTVIWNSWGNSIHIKFIIINSYFNLLIGTTKSKNCIAHCKSVRRISVSKLWKYNKGPQYFLLCWNWGVFPSDACSLTMSDRESCNSFLHLILVLCILHRQENLKLKEQVSGGAQAVPIEHPSPKAEPVKEETTKTKVEMTLTLFSMNLFISGDITIEFLVQF